LSATEPEQPAKSEVENISDITAELVRLLEETEPQPSAAGADDQARRAP